MVVLFGNSGFHSTFYLHSSEGAVEYRSLEKLSPPTVVIVWALYLMHAGLTVFAAWRSIWPLQLGKLIAILTGSLLIIVGAGIFTAGILEFRSFKRMSGKKNDQLITSGIYR